MHLLVGRQNGFDDVVVAGAATDIAVELVADRFLVQIASVARNHVDGRHHHAWRAEAALQAVVFLEGSLNRMQLTVAGKPLDGGDRRTRRLDGKDRAALHRLAIHVNDTGTALVGIAADVRSRQAEFFANKMDKKRTLFTVTADCPAVHRQFHFRHDFLLAPPPGADGII